MIALEKREKGKSVCYDDDGVNDDYDNDYDDDSDNDDDNDGDDGGGVMMMMAKNRL